MKDYVHLHVHTSYSFLDGECKPNELIARAKELGMNAIAITDHNHLGGTLEFQKECLANGIKPILGLEAYYTEDMNMLAKPAEERNQIAADAALKADAITLAEYNVIMKKEKNSKIKVSDVRDKIKPYNYDTKQYHIIFIAMNQQGWRNLIKLQSEAAVRCTFNGRFLCDNELIRKYSEGIICITACIANRIARYVNKNQLDKAEDLLTIWHEIFQDRFYLEIQPLAVPDQMRVNDFYIRMGKKYNIPLISTNDVHYIYKEDHDDHDTLMCIGTGTKKTDTNRMKYSNDYWLRTRNEMEEAFALQYVCGTEFFEQDDEYNYLDEVQKAMDNTVKLAARIDSNIKIGSDKPLIPQVKLPEGETAETHLTVECFKKLYELAEKDKYVAENLPVYEKRLKDEIEIINPKGFASYMLVVQEYVRWANSHNVPTGPGRGSAAGSLALYLLGITKNIDPIKYHLLFSRFLTIDRTEMPDVDIDFLYAGRDSVIHHLEEYYGAQNVCHIGTYTQISVKSGIKDVGRVLSIPFETMNNISKELDKILDIPQPKFKDFDALKDSDNENERKAWEEFHKLESENAEIFRLARKFEGLKRNFGVHASGILAMPVPITDMVPLRIADSVRVSLYTGPEVESCGLIKLDVLGLKSLDIIKDTLYHINKELKFEDLYDMVDINDKNIYDMICNKKTDAIFQLESDLFKGVINNIQPRSMNDIAAITALCRPGPLGCAMDRMYANRRRGEEEAIPLLRNTESIMEETYSLPVYQEDLMRVSVDALGFNMNQADSLVRKIIGKKKVDQMEMLRRIMKYGKINSNGPEGWEDNPNLPWYDIKHKYGDEIDGGIKRGYTEKEMDDFWNNIQNYASYAFNKSHSFCYSYIGVLMAWLKYYHPVEFWAAVLSMQEIEEKREKYINICEQEGIKVIIPDINISEDNFTPNAKDKTIYFGLSSIKGLGAVVQELINNRPYSSIEDMFTRLPKKVLNKRVVLALAQSGALDSFDEDKNRYRIINKIMELRKEKGFQPYNIEEYNNDICIEFETQTLSAPITYKPWWTQIEINESIYEEEAEILNYREQKDRKGGLMAFANLKINNCEIEAVIFASTYKKCLGCFDINLNPSKHIYVTGKKDDKNKLIVKSVEKTDINIESGEINFL